MRIKYFIIPVFVLFFSVGLIPNFAQALIDKDKYEILIQPQPKEINFLNKAYRVNSQKEISISANIIEEKKAANYFVHLFEGKFGKEIKINFESPNENQIKILFDLCEIKNVDNTQFYEISINEEQNSINIKSPSQLGLLFGAVTLSEFFEKSNEKILINLFEIKDYPDFSRRIISANPKPEDIFVLMDFALKNKIETIAIASRQYSWFQVDNDYLLLFKKIKEWKDKFGGPNIMQMHNIYEEKQIEISSEKDLNGLKEVIKTGIENGADKLMILADDTPPFKYGEGYVLTSENDKQKFKHMADAHCYLMDEIKNWMLENSLYSELYYVPPFYTYEDMHYGDMELFKDTHWEDDAFKPLYRDLNYIGANMPEDVFIIWTGPYVRSRKISTDDIKDWTKNLKGTIPFLWDNTIYSHNHFISSPMFTAWENDFPSDFNTVTAGNGIFVNGDANSEDSKASVVTVNDYMWNSKNYSPEKSISFAMNRIYGKENTKLLLEFKEAELSLRKTIGERKLWFESDTLWSVIRKIRFTTGKNPFDYHLNYTRLKALRLQLKNSVPDPVNKNLFIEKCKSIYKTRNELLESLKTKLPVTAERLKKSVIELPDFNKIQ